MSASRLPLPTYAERMSAALDGKGAWVQVETAGGKWKADTSTRPDVAYTTIAVTGCVRGWTSR